MSGYFKGLLRSVLLFAPFFSVFLLMQLVWRSHWEAGAKALAYAGVLAAVLVAGWVWGPPVDVDEVRARYRQEFPASDGERLRSVIPVREAAGGLAYSASRTGHYLAFADSTVTAFTYDRKGAHGVTRLWSADRGEVSLRGGRLVLPDGLGGTRRLVVPVGARGDVEYWLNT